MMKILKTTIKWIIITAAVIVVIVLLCLGVLTTPGLFMTEDKQYRAITVHTEIPIGQEIDSIMAEVFERLDAVPIYDPDRKINLVLCSTQDKFSFFSRFTLRDKRVMGYCLLGNAYVNFDFIKELAGRTRGRPKYHTREGSVVHVATHELMHQYLGDAYGEFASRFLPTWKIEGYIEYGVNQFVAPRDSGYTIPERIDIYLDDTQWNSTAATHRGHYIWGLMMEYLINVKGLSFEEVMADSLTKEAVYQELMVWRQLLKDHHQQPVG
ncbi:MAG: hypothetical protein E4G91_10585 [Candidatus Zixiibacteriota bacterium]|nr:MAG: hypothetical protein E4G91_10585 [candidate division Zixibacteria bacterium]